ncbi:PPA1309 family protein [Gleimia sp. 6138-11-ORH1]|uniref:PPA1309 family protein n=1 Tax=Gleimia sp. 6138-11-ORH1 TaxID=2973937 RepID=UPI002167E3B2|nr:PPA1309 family protein [Gleimia sp. 6138-11-ORH1]MCS4483905.1 PPA1309 family protein [Gleimia sp. 6138-11-ORH1]
MSEAHFPTEIELALTQAVYEIERGASALGWDRPATVYALVFTKDLLAIPELPAEMRQELESSWNGNPAALTAIIQEDLPGADLEETLAQLAWPDSVAGAAVCTERVMVPPQAQASAPEDPLEALEYFANHPDRDEVRLVAAVMRSGEAWCAVRARSHDFDDQVGEGSNLVPGLVDALQATFLICSDNADNSDSADGCTDCSCKE